MKAQKIVIVDYGLGNLFSIQNALKKLGANSTVTGNPSEIKNATSVILPGVGAFGHAMQALLQKDLVDVIRAAVKSGKPLLGICLGMQILFESSEEFGASDGLGLLKGSIKKFPTSVNNVAMRVPFVGWNEIEILPSSKHSHPLEVFSKPTPFYFVHSFYVDPTDNDDVAATAAFAGMDYCCAVVKDNVFATQFHPEKSGDDGLKVFRRWLTTDP